MAAHEKEDFMSQIEHYRAVLEDLQRQRNLYNLKISEIDQAMASLHRLIPEDAKPDLPPPLPQSKVDYVAIPRDGRYAGMSVRWAILYLLSEIATTPLSTGHIAAILREGGVTSTAAKFAGNVSAILSVMSKQRGEVLAVGEGWTISEIGRQAWAHIRAKREAEQTVPTSSPNVN
jgi:hypothetical protein